MSRIITVLFLCMMTWVAHAANPSTASLTVALDTQLNPDHALLIVAKEQGFFKERGLDVKLIPPAHDNDSTKLAASGKVDIGVTYQSDLMRQVDAGKKLVRVGTLIDRPLDCIATMRDSGIETIADLRGKRIGITKSSLSNVTLKAMLKSAGLSEKDVTIVPLNHDLSNALIKHKVDAVAGMARNVDVPQLERKGYQINTFFPEENGIPNYSVLILVTSAANVNDTRLPRFLGALREAVDYLDDHPKQAWQAFIKHHPQANNKLNHDMWFATLPYFAEDPAVFDHDEWKHFAEFMHNNEMIKMAQPVSKYAVTIG